MSMRWNGIEIAHAPIISKPSPWQRVNIALEDKAILLILPCLVLGWVSGLQFA